MVKTKVSTVTVPTTKWLESFAAQQPGCAVEEAFADPVWSMTRPGRNTTITSEPGYYDSRSASVLTVLVLSQRGHKVAMFGVTVTGTVVLTEACSQMGKLHRNLTSRHLRIVLNRALTHSTRGGWR